MARRDATQARRRLFGRGPRKIGSFAMIQPQRSARVTSAALRKVGDKGLERGRDRTWQTQAFEMVDSIGELGYVLNLKASVLAACNLQPQRWDPTERVWTSTDDERVLRVMAAFIGPQGGQGELKRRASLHLSIGGESMLLGSPVDVASVETGLWWEFLSTDEVQIEALGQIFRKADGVERTQLDPESYAARMWRSHPRYSQLADSELRRVLDLCQEIVLLGQYVQAVARSRLAAGALFIPDEFSFASTDDESGDAPPDDADDGDGIDDFEEELIGHLEAPVQDRTSSASLVPLIIRGPAEHGDKIRLIDLARELDTFAQELREEALGRLARALDAPPELVSGKADLNHWTAYNVDDDFIGRHVVPQGQLIADFATFSYLRPMLEEYEEVAEGEAAMFRLAFDPSPVAARADEGNTSRSLHQLGDTLISDDSVRTANGFGDEDKPEDDEVYQRRAWELVRTRPDMFAVELLPTIKGFEGVDVESFKPPPPIVVESPEEAAEVEALGAEAEAADDDAVEAAETDTQQEPQTEGNEQGFTLLVTRLSTAADSALERALERAGARLVSKASAHLAVRDRLRVADKTRALSLVRPTELVALGLTPAGLLDGAWDGLSLRARRWISAELRSQGVDRLDADDRAALAASTMCDKLGAWVQGRIHDQFPLLPNGLRVPDDIVVSALSALVLSPAA